MHFHETSVLAREGAVLKNISRAGAGCHGDRKSDRI